jgi:hypothetical protein
MIRVDTQFRIEALLKSLLIPKWSTTGLPVVPRNPTHLRQGFGGSSEGEQNPLKHDRSIAGRILIQSLALLRGQGRGFLRRRMKGQ